MASDSQIQSNSSSRNGEQVLLFPFMAQGHIIPFVGLAKLLEQRTPHTITIINTPLNIQKLRSFLPPSTTIQLSELPFNGPDHGFPPNCEDTSSLPSPDLILKLIQASESLQPSFNSLLSDLCNSPKPPLCIISDEFMAWTVQSAAEFGVFHSVFNTSGAYGSALFMSVWTHLPHRQIDESVEEFPLPDFPETTLRRSQLSEACRSSDGSDSWAVLLRKQFAFIEESGGVLVNSVEELEGKGLEQLRKKNQWGMVWAIGPLFPPPPPLATRSGVESDCIEWLDLYTPDSVLYVSFGSQSSVGPLQMIELAKGLEATSHAFIWVIRPPIGFDVNEEFQAEWLPEGFEDGITEKRQGILVKKWAPQMEILAHESTGAFLSHCGWNSVLESLSCGKPIIGWPLSAEQPFNSKLVQDELGVGVEMARGSMAEIRADDVAGAVELVMGGESDKGREMRRKAKEIAELMKAAVVEEESCKGSSVRAIEDFIQTALSRKES